MAKIKITQTRSVIGSDKGQRATMKALGILKIRYSVEKEVTPALMGMVEKVRHLVSVENL
jgi:large subunit ribosomal protein L30